MKLLDKQTAKLLEWIKGTETEVLGEEEVRLHTNMRPIVIFGFAALIFGFFGFIIWASLAPMVSGIGIPGTVSASSHEDIITSRYGGTIKKIAAREGDTVKKKQPIMFLDGSTQKSNLAQIKSRYITYLAMYSRLLAEESGASQIKFSTALSAFKNSNQAKAAMAVQEKLFIAETANYEAQKNIFKSAVSSIKGYLVSEKEMKKTTENQITLAKKEVGPLDRLASEGYYPRSKVMQMQADIQGLEGKLNEEEGNISRMQGTLTQNELKLYNLKNDFSRKVNAELNGVQGKVYALKRQYRSALSQYKNTVVSSGVDGTIVKIYNKTVGGAVLPGQPIVDILPLNQSLIVKGDVPVQFIARIHKGLKADLRFPAFDVADVPVLSGKVIYVSAASIANPVSHMPFYVCKIKISRRGLEALARRKLELKAGMPAQVTVETGSRTLMSSFLNPLLYKISQAFVK